MSIKILTQNSIDNTNIDGARQNHFSAGMRSGIVKGAFNEGKFFASASNIIALDSCELIISGHQVVIDSTETITLNDRPSTPTKYSMIAEIQVSDSSVPSFRLFIQPANVSLKKDNLFKTNNGSGIYQLRIGNFTLGTTGLISDVVRTADIITGGGEGGIADIKFNATATQLSSSSQPEVNADYNEETKEWDLHFGIPAGGGSRVTIGGVEQPTWSADFAESERQKSKNLWKLPIQRKGLEKTTTINGVTFTVNTDNSVTINGTATARAVFYLEPTSLKELDAGTYTFGMFLERNYNVYVQCHNMTTNTYDILAGRNALTKTLTFDSKPVFEETWGLYISVDAGATINNLVFYPIVVKGTDIGDYQEWNGAIVHEKQLNEAVEQRELFYNVRKNKISIESSTLTTLQEFFDLFGIDDNKIYVCQIGNSNNNNFKNLLPSVDMGGYVICYIKLYANDFWGDLRLKTYEIIALNQLNNQIAKGYLYYNLNKNVVFTGWTKIGG